MQVQVKNLSGDHYSYSCYQYGRFSERVSCFLAVWDLMITNNLEMIIFLYSFIDLMLNDQDYNELSLSGINGFMHLSMLR
jgi:hypothetical protein